MEHTVLIPRHFVIQNHLTLFLYKVDENILTEGNIFSTSILTPSLFEKINFSQDNNWTYGNGVLDKINYILKPYDCYIVLHTGGRSPYANDIGKLQLKLYTNDTELSFVKQGNSTEDHIYIFKLDKNISIIRQIRIQSATFIPKEMGMNEDERMLGVDILYLEIKEKF